MMGSVLSTCKSRKRAQRRTIIHHKYTQTTNSSYQQYLHMRRRSISPFRPTVVNKHSCHVNPHALSSRTNLSRVRSIPKIVCNPSNRYYRSESCQTSSTINKNERSYQQNDGQKLLSTFIPVNTFLIDISNEQVRIGQPIFMYIRHLLLDPPLDSPTTSSGVNTSRIRENLLSYMSDVCEQYPNSNQSTRNTMYVRLRT